MGACCGGDSYWRAFIHLPFLYTCSAMNLQIVLVAALCLCSCGDSPEPTVLLEPAPRAATGSDSATPGFTLIAPIETSTVYLVDMSGTAIHTWPSEHKPGVATYLTERGTLMKCQRIIDHETFQNSGGLGGRIQELDWNGDVLWDFSWDSEKGLSHHDIEIMPNGNILFIAWDRTTRKVALAAGRDPELLAGDEFWSCGVYEIKPTYPTGGDVVWSWHTMDHLLQNYDESLPSYGIPSLAPHKVDINGDFDDKPLSEEEEKAEEDKMAAIGYGGAANSSGEEEEDDRAKAERKARTKNADWMHTNAIDYHAGLDQIVLSVRRFDEVWIIDHGITTEEAKGPKGDLLYRWGNPYAYGMGEWGDRKLFGQHHIQWIPEGGLGAGNLILFNNGAKQREHSTVDEFWPPLTSDGTYARDEAKPWGPTETQWAYAAETPEDFFSPFISGVQRLASGNTLICSGAQGWVFEVTPAGKVVWDWKNPYGARPDEVEEDMEGFPSAVFRAERFAADSPEINALRKRGAPIPESSGAGPATNQRPEPEPEEESEEESKDD